jgi:hypothetical protein
MGQESRMNWERDSLQQRKNKGATTCQQLVEWGDNIDRVRKQNSPKRVASMRQEPRRKGTQITVLEHQSCEKAETKN